MADEVFGSSFENDYFILQIRMNVTLTMEDAITNAIIHTVHTTALAEIIIILGMIIKLVMVRYLNLS